MDPNTTTLFNPLGMAAGATVLVPYLLQLIKRFLPNVSDDALGLIMKTLQAVFAIAVSVGIQKTFDASTGTLVVTGLTPWNLLNFGMQVAAQYKSFEIVYRTAIKPSLGASGRP